MVGVEGRGEKVSAGLGAFACLGLMVLIGSSTAVAAKFAVRELPLGLVPIVRFGVAALCLGPIFLRGGTLGRMIREDGWRLALASALCVPANQAFFLAGARLAPASHIGLIYAACPLVVLALACLLKQERLTRGRLIGVAATVAGVALIALENVGKAGVAGRDALRGDLLEVGAVIAWGAYLTVNKPLVARHGALPVLAATFVVGSALDLPIALASAPGWSGLAGVSASAWLGLAYLALVVSVFGLAFQNLAMRSFDASQVATFGNISPLLTVGWGALLFGERLSPVVGVGGLLVLAGVARSGASMRVADRRVALGGLAARAEPGRALAGVELAGPVGDEEFQDRIGAQRRPEPELDLRVATA